MQTLAPLSDPRWNDFLLRCGRASVFHTTSWIRSLQRAYRYEPIAFTTAAPGEPLQDGLVCCRVSSWVSGQRLVSLPFSDHCAVLSNNGNASSDLVSEVAKYSQQQPHRYLEIRPLRCVEIPGFYPGPQYYFHEIDLRPGVDTVHSRLHHDCIQRKIRRAEREKLQIKQGNSRELADVFYRLHRRARRRLGVLPQPMTWFEALRSEFGHQLQIRVGFAGDVPIASILTLQFKQTMVYKYGASDPKHNAKGAMPAILWDAIQEACRMGCTSFDLGRSDLGQDGLIEFKDRWGAEKSLLTYYRYSSAALTAKSIGNTAFSKKVFSAIPESISPWLARLIYRHVG
jgi:hypothetical protein